jgi:hypothetical protein
MEASLTRKELMAVLRLKGDDAIVALERRGLPYLLVGNRKRYRTSAVEAFLEKLEQASSTQAPLLTPNLSEATARRSERPLRSWLNVV